ncbi:MAG: hypothetical protein ABFE07_26190 [Armatimonadia bacterium]
MSKLLCLVALIMAVGLAVPAFAGDIVAMPTGNMMAKDAFEFNYIFWDLDTPPGPAPDNAQIGEFFYGVTDRLEVDLLTVDVENDHQYTEGNIYYALVKEKPGKPSLIVGATNITGSKWLGDDRVSPFYLSAYNIHVPQGKPTFNDPLVRVHVAWGDNYHGDAFFGGFQFLFTPRIGAAAFSYNHNPSYVGVYRAGRDLELRTGWKSGSPFYSFGYDTKF